MQRNTITWRRILDGVGLMYCLPLAVVALFTGCQLRREIFLRGKTWKVADPCASTPPYPRAPIIGGTRPGWRAPGGCEA